jgi:hypothetical protein
MAGMFGVQEELSCLQKVAIQGKHGESLCLASKIEMVFADPCRSRADPDLPLHRQRWRALLDLQRAA